MIDTSKCTLKKMILIFPLRIFHLHAYVEQIPATSAYGMYISQTIRHPKCLISLSAAKSNNLKFNNLWFDPNDDQDLPD